VAVQDRVGVAEVVTRRLGVETAIAIIEFTQGFVQFIVPAGSPIRDFSPTATGSDAGNEVGIETRGWSATAATDARSTTNDVAFPSGRRREAARTPFFGRIFRRAASSTGRVFCNCASRRLQARRLAVGQACAPTFNVVTHANWARYRATYKTGSGQCLGGRGLSTPIF